MSEPPALSASDAGETHERFGQQSGVRARAKLIGNSPQMRSLCERIAIVSGTQASVVILGESGTGKELVARAVHDASGHAAGPFVAVNCAALPETLIEAELFGHQRGAFTGATGDREGRFRAADGGTLLLDEAGEIPLAAQAKLLRVLQEGTIEPLGSSAPQKVNVRILCATHRNLKQMVAAGTFREDLYYRLQVFELHVPSLRERRSDLGLLASHFYHVFGGERRDLEILPRAWAVLLNYGFPGNVRELEHAIQHAVVLSRGKPIDIEHLPSDIRAHAGATESVSASSSRLGESMKAFERRCLVTALEATDGVKFKAALLLGISRKTLWEKLKAHGVRDSESGQGEF